MLLQITTTHAPATDLGYLLHKNPARHHRVALTFGTAHVFYPEASEARCTAALLLDVDPVKLVRGRPGQRGTGMLTQYVNDRPYAVSSFMSVAIARAFGTAIAGNSKERPELAETPIPLAASLGPVMCRAGADFIARLFAPLGYEVSVDEAEAEHPEWEDGLDQYATLTLSATCTLAELLRHLYVLIPVLDNDKHYWIGDDEVDKLVARGEGWLAAHPEKDQIVRRYLKNRRRLTNSALARLAETEPDPDEAREARAEEEEALEAPIRLNDLRMQAVVAELRDSGARRVLDLGCSGGRLLRELMRERQFEEIVGVDVSIRALEIAHGRLGLDRMSAARSKRIRLLHGALTYRDERLEGYDAAAVVEVIEHLDLARLEAFEKVLFGFARPRTVVVTTPNIEFNATFEDLAAGAFRHRDHRFEWTRAEFRDWADGVAGRNGYEARFGDIGEADARLGPPTQMAVFGR